jgi:hypothetical protein
MSFMGPTMAIDNSALDRADFTLAASLRDAAGDPGKLQELVGQRTKAEVTLAVRLLLSEAPLKSWVGIQIADALPQFRGVRQAVMRHIRQRMTQCIPDDVKWMQSGGSSHTERAPLVRPGSSPESATLSAGV